MITLERKRARKTLTERENHPQSTFIVVNSDSKVVGTYALTHKKKCDFWCCHVTVQRRCRSMSENIALQ